MLPAPFLVLTIADIVSPPNPDDDLRPIGNAILLVVGTFVLIVGVVAHKLARSPEDEAKSPSNKL